MFERILSLVGTAIGGIFSTPVRSNRRPTGAALRNPADPIQAARIEAAAVKRARRADKLERDSNQSWKGNYTHHAAFHRLDDATGYILPLNLNPFYIAK